MQTKTVVLRYSRQPFQFEIKTSMAIVALINRKELGFGNLLVSLGSGGYGGDEKDDHDEVKAPATNVSLQNESASACHRGAFVFVATPHYHCAKLFCLDLESFISYLRYSI
jgi:hypothetical protein